jgi:hypothetical protein
MHVARKAQAAQFAANVLPIIGDIQAAGHKFQSYCAGSTLGRYDLARKRTDSPFAFLERISTI